MTVKIRQNLVATSKHNIKAPHSMVPKFITVHNTANDASANNEIAFMVSNNNQVSFHFAVDDVEIVQGLPLNRNGWHSGDGANGTGNRQSIAVEICYSKSGGTRFTKAEQNAAWLVAKLMRDHNIPLANVRTHQSWNGKNCPHRTLSLGWQRFLDMVQVEFNKTGNTNNNNSGNTHTVRAGETLSGIAKQYNSTVNAIAQANNIANPNVIRVGQVLQLPSGSTPAPTQSFYPATRTTGSGLVDTLNSIKVDSSFTNRQRIATANKISNYSGTAAQNNQLLSLLNQGKLVRP